VDIMIEILPSLPKENVDFILKNVLSSYLLHRDKEGDRFELITNVQLVIGKMKNKNN
jgi:hypothetical protein